MRVLPVENDFLHVVERVEQEMITPFSPADGHGAILVHTGNQSNSMKNKAFPPTSFKNGDTGTGHKREASLEVFFLLCHLSLS